MSRYRMAAKPFLLSMLWTSTAMAASAATFTLSSDITNFIPSCALSCFESFLEANFLPSTCGSSPSLQCLCSHEGSSGYTVGEGAVACLIAENNVGACQGMDASSQVASKAYVMCSGQKSAVPETHATIIATLVVPTGTSPAVVPSPTPTTLVTMTSSTSLDAPSSTPPTASVVAYSSPSPTPTISTAPVTDTSGTSSQERLNPAQIAGISLGAVAFALLMITVFLCVRSRRREYSQSGGPGFSKMRDSWNFGRKNDGSPRMLQISAPMHVEPQELDVTRALEHRVSVRPDTIGVALSPDGSVMAVAAPTPPRRTLAQVPTPPARTMQSPPRRTQAETPTSVAETAPVPTPPKPALTLAIPQEKPGRLLQRMPFSGRDSIVTEFAEDGDEGDVSAGGALIWRPPPTDPTSATTYYVADKWGNWILGSNNRMSQAAELEGSSPLSKTEAEKHSIAQATKAAALPSASSSLPSKPGPAKLGPPIQFRQQASDGRRSSRVYSNYSMPHAVASGPSHPIPAARPAADSYQTFMRQNSSKRPNRKSRPLDRSDSRISEHSATTIASSTAEGGDGDVIDPESNLSPVVESPLSAGVSPVTYPRITGRQQQEKLKLFPSPARGDAHHPHPPGQPSPTLGDARTVTAQGAQPMLAAVPPPNQARNLTAPNLSLNPNPNRNPAQIRTGSPNMPQGQQQPQQQQTQQSAMAGRVGSPDRQDQALARFSPAQMGTMVKTPPLTPGSFHSTASSLLAKRVGEERAAALALGGDEHRPQHAKWRLQARKQGLQPGGGGGGGAQGPITPGFYVEELGHVPLPATPGWQPKLTPTRRGDDLFLSVR